MVVTGSAVTVVVMGLLSTVVVTVLVLTIITGGLYLGGLGYSGGAATTDESKNMKTKTVAKARFLLKIMMTDELVD